MNFREKLIRFMQGRYGIDQLSKFILVIGVVCVLIPALFGDHPAALIPYFLGWILVIYSYYRVFIQKCDEALCGKPDLPWRRLTGSGVFFQKQKNICSSGKYITFIHARPVSRRSASRKGKERSKCAARNAAPHLLKKADRAAAVLRGLSAYRSDLHINGLSRRRSRGRRGRHAYRCS